MVYTRFQLHILKKMGTRAVAQCNGPAKAGINLDTGRFADKVPFLISCCSGGKGDVHKATARLQIPQNDLGAMVAQNARCRPLRSPRVAGPTLEPHVAADPCKRKNVAHIGRCCQQVVGMIQVADPYGMPRDPVIHKQSHKWDNSNQRRMSSSLPLAPPVSAQWWAAPRTD